MADPTVPAPAPEPASVPPSSDPAAPVAVAWASPVYAVAPPKGVSIASMVLGLASVFFFWTFVCPVVGLVLGVVGFRREPAGRGYAIAGIVLNGVMILIPVVVLVFLITAGATLFGVSMTSGT